MKVVYTESPGKEKGVCYRLPSPFFGVISAADEVVVEGDYPNIVDAYEGAGVKVTQPKAAAKPAAKKETEDTKE